MGNKYSMLILGIIIGIGVLTFIILITNILKPTIENTYCQELQDSYFQFSDLVLDNMPLKLPIGLYYANKNLSMKVWECQFNIKGGH